MQTGPKIALAVTALALLAIGGEVGYIHYRNNHDEVATPRTADAGTGYKLTDDDTVAYTTKKLRPSSPKDEKELIGKTIWVSAAGQMDYYKAKGKHADYAHPEGTLKGAEPLIIKDVFEQMPPATGRAVSRISAGKGHVLLAFTMPKGSDPNQLYAVPVGLKDADGTGYTFLTDEIFFYDDPHELYKHWGAQSWAHVDKHECVVGMSENQCMMAIGQVIEPHGDKPGERSITFNNDGHPIDVNFTGGKATSVKAE